MNGQSIATSAVPEEFSRQAWADWAGMLASIGCAIHCASLPLLIAYLPALGLEWLAGEGFHQWMAIVCVILATTAFLPGWWKHRSFVPAAFGGGGLLLLTTAAYGMEGRCCPSCEVELSEAVAVPACCDASGEIYEQDRQVVAGSGELRRPAAAIPACCEVSCDTCAQEKQVVVGSVEHAGFDAAFVPLMTPLGGLLLVIGHVVNHRKSCRCKQTHCCLANEDEDTESHA